MCLSNPTIRINIVDVAFLVHVRRREASNSLLHGPTLSSWCFWDATFFFSIFFFHSVFTLYLLTDIELAPSADLDMVVTCCMPKPWLAMH